jgi:hypothetical protein
MGRYLRQSDFIYRSDRTVGYGYGTAGEVGDVMSRVNRIDSSFILEPVAAYTYLLGLGTIVEENYEQAGVKLDR